MSAGPAPERALLGTDGERGLCRRGGQPLRIPARELVPGDVIVLEAGAQVPADGRLLRSAALRVTEAALTGESVPAEKDAGARLDPETALAERSTMVYLGTAVVGGSGTAVVTATGVATELGRIGQLVALAEERRTPLERQVETLGRRGHPGIAPGRDRARPRCGLRRLAVGAGGLVAAPGTLDGLGVAAHPGRGPVARGDMASPARLAGRRAAVARGLGRRGPGGALACSLPGGNERVGPRRRGLGTLRPTAEGSTGPGEAQMPWKC